MLNGEGKPTTPIQHFKRHMYSPDDDDIEEAERDIVTVQIKGKKVIIPLPSSLIPFELGKSSAMLFRIHYFYQPFKIRVSLLIRFSIHLRMKKS